MRFVRPRSARLLRAPLRQCTVRNTPLTRAPDLESASTEARADSDGSFWTAVMNHFPEPQFPWSRLGVALGSSNLANADLNPKFSDATR